MSERILIIRHGALGDMIQSMGPIAAIRRHHPDATITLLTTPPFRVLGEACPWIDEVWVDQRPSWLKIGTGYALLRRLRGGGFTRVYDLQTSRRSSVYFHFFPRRQRPQWSGIAAGASHRHTDPLRNDMHTIDRQREQLRLAGITDVPAPDLDWFTADVGGFDLARPYALIVAGGSAHRPGKRWPVRSYAGLCRRLADDGVTAVLIGGPDEAGLGREIATQAPAAVDLIGRTSFAQIAELARGAVVAVGNDTGPMHIVAAVGCPAVVLFSNESEPRLCVPRGGVVEVLRQARLDELSVDAVVETARRLQRQIDLSARQAS